MIDLWTTPMVVHRSADQPIVLGETWEKLWQGSDGGLVCAWARGIEKAKTDPDLQQRALRGELPPLAWKGGCDKALKAGRKIGALHYLATWQGLRGNDLQIDTDAEVERTCSRTGVVVTFTGDVNALLAFDVDEGSEG